MNLDLTPSEVACFIPLPGRCLILVTKSSDNPMSDSGLLHLPQAAAKDELERAAVREGKLIAINRGVLNFGDDDKSYCDAESLALRNGMTVWYLGHADEVDNSYVVAKIGQIVAVAKD